MNLNAILAYIAALFSILTALVVLYRDPRSFVHRVFAAGMTVLGIEAGMAGLGYQAYFLSDQVFWHYLKILPHSLVPGVWLLFSLTYGRANYRDFLKRWKWTIGGSFLPLLIFGFFHDSIFAGEPILDSTLKLFFRIALPGYILYLLFLIGAVLILMNLERTFRHSIGHTRWQIKFMVLGVGSIFGARIYTESQVILFRLLDTGLEIVNIAALILGTVFMARSFWRAKLLKFDFYLSHSFLYNSVTVLLIGVYFITVGVVARLVFYLRGTQDPAITALLVFVAILVLALFLMSDRLRLERKRLISRHFRRPRYDYPRVWARFTERTASLTEMTNLCNNIVRMVSETLEILEVTIWTMDEKEEHLIAGGSTIFSGKEADGVKITGECAKVLIQGMRQRTMPVVLDQANDDWTGDLKSGHGESLKEAHIDVCVPLSAAGRLVGILTLGKKVSHEPYSFEDLELLKTIADQAAANLLTLQLGERLQKAKEMEAFQVMSAFFMHDLKNLASRLSLVTQNFPIHYQNPEFRNDALRTISQSLEKINGLCSRLSLLSQKLELHAKEVDFNDLIRNTVSGMEMGLKVKPVLALNPLPKLSLDPEEIQKVLTNLLFNANDAIRDGGSIQISTAEQGNFVSVCVADTGCGMSPDFVNRTLFRPFKTTKKKGMGIGLFHSKKIIEAHQGRIEAESEEGKGTTFKVFLPIRMEKGIV